MAPAVLTVRDAAVANGKIKNGTTIAGATHPAWKAIMGEPAIKVTGLRKSFGEKEAVAGIDLEIAAVSSAARACAGG
jgi:hypothetical protein